MAWLYWIHTMLKIENLHARIGDKEILKGLSLDVKPGQVHAIMEIGRAHV